MSSSSSSSSTAHSDSLSAHQKIDWDVGAVAFQAVAKFTARAAEPSAKQLVEAAAKLLHHTRTLKKLIYLDVATGTGVTIWEFLKCWQDSSLAHAAEAEVDIYATDIAQNMLDLLKKSIPTPLPRGISSVSCAILDMDQLDSFVAVTPKESVHLLNCCFGIMFVKNPQQALKNIHSILAPGGVAAIVAGHYSGFLEHVQALARAHKKLPETEALPMIADLQRFGMEGNVRPLLRAAGFNDEDVTFHFDSVHQKFQISVLIAFMKGTPFFAPFVEDEALAQHVLQQRAERACGKGEVMFRATGVTIICTKKSQ